jgi:hypothetical protein
MIEGAAGASVSSSPLVTTAALLAALSALRNAGSERRYDLAGPPRDGRRQRRYACGPFKWNGDAVHPDLAWAYDFPTRELQPIAGLIAFHNEQVDVSIDGELMPQPGTHFSRSAR